MQIHIGIIGPPLFIAKTMQVIKTFPTFAPVAHVADDEQAVLLAAIALQDQVEVLLLSGMHAQSQIKQRLSSGLPVHAVPLTGAGLYKALFLAAKTDQLDRGISVDTLTHTIVARTLKDLGLNNTSVAVYEGPAYADHALVTAFHQANLATDTCSVAITGSGAVAADLTQQGLAAIWLQPSEQDIIVALERALLSTESRRHKESQIVVGMINIDEFGKLVSQRHSEYEVQKLKLDIHRMVLGYVELLDGYLTSLGGDEYLFFTTRGIFERETGGYKVIPLAKDARKSYGLSLSIGIGFGRSANEAGTHARTALRKAKEAGGNAAFIVREDDTVIGPLEMADPVQADLAPTEPALIRRAEEAGMTSAYLSRLLSQLSRSGKYEYRVHDLANTLGISVRSAHRLLQLWMDHGLVAISGVEKVPKGRPRQIYEFLFLKDKSL